MTTLPTMAGAGDGNVRDEGRERRMRVDGAYWRRGYRRWR